MNAISIILNERKRQKEVEGWTPEHDDSHVNGELAKAASCYATPTDQQPESGRILMPFLPYQKRWWPFEISWWKPTPDNRIRELARAGALIIAEIERLQRKGYGPESDEFSMKNPAKEIEMSMAKCNKCNVPFDTTGKCPVCNLYMGTEKTLGEPKSGLDGDK